MKKNIKKIMPVVMIASILGTSAVSASNLNVPATSETITTLEVSQNLVIELIKEGENLLFPARTVFEKLGFEVSYEPTTKIVTAVKGAQYVTFSTAEDGYTFARMAAQKLGQAPIVKDGSTYVPVTLLTEIMQMEGVSVDGLTLTIESQDEEINVELDQTIITEIDEKANTITVNHPINGTIVLNTKDLKIEYTTEDKVLMVGQAVEVEYGDINTASEPAINTPKSLKVVQKYNIVQVLNIEKDDKGNTMVLVKDAEIGEVMLVVSKSTKIEGMESAEELEIGQVLKVAMSNAMTMSIPPQTTAKEISVLVFDIEIPEIEVEEMAETSTVEVVSVDKKDNKITIKDEKMGEIVLNISEEIKLEGISDVNQIYELKSGDKLNVVYGDAMTKSLPPINNPVRIGLAK